MNKQRGGSFTINGWLGLLLLVVCAAQGLAINRLIDQNDHLKLQLMYHKMMTEDLVIRPGDDYYTTRCFSDQPDERACICDEQGTVCTTKI